MSRSLAVIFVCAACSRGLIARGSGEVHVTLSFANPVDHAAVERILFERLRRGGAGEFAIRARSGTEVDVDVERVASPDLVRSLLSIQGKLGLHRVDENGVPFASPELDNKAIATAEVRRDRDQPPSVLITWTQAAAPRWTALTEASIEKQIAILIDGNVLSMPIVKEKITAPQAVLTLGVPPEGLDAETHARLLAFLLSLEPLPQEPIVVLRVEAGAP